MPRLRRSWGLGRPPLDVPFELNDASPQAEGLVLWMPWGGGDPGTGRHVDRIRGLVFSEGGTPVWVADGERGWSLLFDDAASEYLEATSTPVTGAPLTLTAWIRPDNLSGNFSIVSINNGNWNQSWQIKTYYSARAQFVVTDGDQQEAETAINVITLNNWHHIVGVERATDDRSIFVDGGNEGTDASPQTPSGVDRVHISRRGNSDWYFSGRIADVRIYNVAKTGAQARQMVAKPWDLIRPLRRWWVGWVAAAPPADAMPMAMDLYRRRRAA